MNKSTLQETGEQVVKTNSIITKKHQQQAIKITPIELLIYKKASCSAQKDSQIFYRFAVAKMLCKSFNRKPAYCDRPFAVVAQVLLNLESPSASVRPLGYVQQEILWSIGRQCRLYAHQLGTCQVC